MKRLRKDQSGNTIALMAAGLIPLTAMIGSGVDISRVYLVKTRLQQACDAGALAGRKTMGSGAWNTSSFAARTVANNMFDANFSAGTSGSEGLMRSYTETGGVVTGRASVEVPMVIMDMFGREETPISVQCDAQLAVPNTDVMFVLDVTGSMNWADDGSNNTTNVEIPKSKIIGMRLAVRCFYEALSKQNTVADCGSTPTGATQTAQTRFGFVPYAVNVNVGRLLPTQYMADNFTYQSRVPVLTPVWAYSLGAESGKSYGSYSNPATPSSPSSSYVALTPSGTATPQNKLIPNGTTVATVTNVSSSSCTSSAKPAAYTITATTPTDVLNSTNGSAPVHPATTHPHGTYTSTLAQTRYFYQWVYDTGGSAANRRCRLQQATYTNASYNKTAVGTTTKPVTWTEYTDTFTNWDYRPVTHNVSGLKNGSGWNSSVALPVGFTTQSLLVSGSTTSTSYKRVANVNATWDGCVEERQTVRTTNFDPLPSAANDLNIDLLPTGDDTTKWAPLLPNAVWGRYTGSSTETLATVTTATDLGRNINNFTGSCPAAARIPTTWATAAAFDAYVAGLTAGGSTYHDIGLIWGARLISPTGIFAANNTNRQNIQRHLIFMTDGDTSTAEQNYGAYGVEWWDRRRTPTGTTPTVSLLDAQVNGRFLAMCEYVKNEMGITLWVVAFGAGVSGTAKANLETCASSGRYSEASNSNALLSTFRGIADEISDLRLTS